MKYTETRWGKRRKKISRHYVQVVLQISQHRAGCDVSFQELSTALTCPSVRSQPTMSEPSTDIRKEPNPAKMSARLVRF